MDNSPTFDATVTSTGRGLVPVGESAPAAALVMAWTSSAPDGSRIGETAVLQGTGFDLNRASAIFPGGRIEDREISRVHARIFPAAGGRWAIVDLGSKNGTFVNGGPVPQDGGSVLDFGDVIRTGDTFFVFNEVMFPALSDAEVQGYLGVSDSAREVRSSICRYAPSGLPVLITGESGAGKEVVAGAVARLGRPGRPSVEFNAAGIGSSLAGTTLFGHVKGAFTDARESRPGLFREADTGTLFLDEIGELSREVQAQMLRVLEDGMVTPVGASKSVKVDVRVVAATNRDLRDPSIFRQDLFMRLAQLTIHVPPVRRRREDIMMFVMNFSEGRSFTVRAIEKLLVHPWPLNVREIRGIVAQALADAPEDDSPVELSRTVLDRMSQSASAFEMDTRPDNPLTIGPAVVENALREAGGNMSVAARMVGRDRAQFYRIVKKFGFDPDSFRK